MSRTVLMRALGYLGGVLAILAGVYRLSQADEAGAAVAFGIGFSLLGVTDLVGRLADRLKAILPDWLDLDSLIDRLLERIQERPDGPIVVGAARTLPGPAGVLESAECIAVAAAPCDGLLHATMTEIEGCPACRMALTDPASGRLLFEVTVCSETPDGPTGLRCHGHTGDRVTAGDILIERRR